MNKHEFLDHLERLLKSLPRQERQKMLAYYTEMIDDRMEEGMSEQEAVQDLGDAGMLAEQILSAQPSKEKKLSNPMKVDHCFDRPGQSFMGMFVVGIACFDLYWHTTDLDRLYHDLAHSCIVSGYYGCQSDSLYHQLDRISIFDGFQFHDRSSTTRCWFDRGRTFYLIRFVYNLCFSLLYQGNHVL